MERLQGAVRAGFEQLAETFASVTKDPHHRGAALHVRIDGVPVCDLWTGELRDGVRWTPDTPTTVFSVSKALMAILMARLVEEGYFDLDDPVARYWPEFGAAGKQEVTIRQVMSHRAGLPFVRRDLARDDLVDQQRMATILEAEPLFFAQGTTHLYHALTGGWILGELVRRVAGISASEAFRARVADPVAADAWLGVPEHMLSSIAQLFVDEKYPVPLDLRSEHYPELAAYCATGLTLGHAIPERFADAGVGFNDPIIQQAVVPSAGIVASARALATIFSSTVTNQEGIAPLLDDVILDMVRPQSSGAPALAMTPPWPTWATGFMLNSDARPFLSNASFGHDGVGGQVAFADRDARLGFAFVSNGLRMGSDSRAKELVFSLRSIMN